MIKDIPIAFIVQEIPMVLGIVSQEQGLRPNLYITRLYFHQETKSSERPDVEDNINIPTGQMEKLRHREVK